MVVITMTSWTERINLVKTVLESVMKQTILPDRIYLNLSSTEFDGVSLPKDLVDYIAKNKHIILNWVDGPNTKPFKKMLPILKFLNDDDIIIDIDDDLILSPVFVESRLKDFKTYNTCISGSHNSIPWYGYGLLPEVKHWLAAGSLYQKKMLKHWEEILCPEIIATNHDDAFYDFMCWLNGYTPESCTQNNTHGIFQSSTALHGSIGGCSNPVKATIINSIAFSNKFHTVPSFNYFKTNTNRPKDTLKMPKLKFILSDRVRKAGDNGEYLYRYLRNNIPNIELGYILNKESSDWNRLLKDNFNLISATDTVRIKKELSSATYFCFSYFPREVGISSLDCQAYKVFLNHGCFYRILPYLKKHGNDFDLMLAGNKLEYNTLINEYKFDKSKIALTGLPRQDSLIRQNNSYIGDTNNILIQFWWRPWLKVSPEVFAQSEFYNNVSKLLSDPRLKDISEKYNIKFLFKLHCEMEPFIEYFKKFDSIELVPNEAPFEPLFVKSKMIVTDLTSNVYEMGMIGKPCLYFRPDWPDMKKKLLASGNSILDVAISGIGPAADTVDEFFTNLEAMLSNNYSIDQKYLSIRNDQLVFMNDPNCCNRALEKILITLPANKSSRQSKSNNRSINYGGDLWL